MLDQLGGQRVGIPIEVAVLDGSGVPVRDEYLQAEFTKSTVWVDGCLFELQTPGGLSTDKDAGATVDSETAWCLMPVTAGAVPAVTDDGEALSVPAGQISALVYGSGRPFLVQGKAAVEVDDEGREDHVFVVCTRRLG